MHLRSISRGLCVALLLVGLLGGGAAFGATTVWGYCGLQAVVAAAAVCWCLAGDARLRLLVLPGLVVALGVAQLIPVSRHGLTIASPLKKSAIDAASSESVGVASTSVSVYPGQTRATLRRWLSLAVALVLVADLARRRWARRTLTAGVAVAGVAMIAIGLAAPVSQNNVLRFYDLNRPKRHDDFTPLLSPFHGTATGVVEEVSVDGIRYSRDTYGIGYGVGSMVNANHFAAYIGLTTPVIVALLLGVPPRRWYCLGPGIIAAAGLAATALYLAVFVAESRAGGAALAAALTVTALSTLCPARRRARVIISSLLVAALLGSAATAYFYFAGELSGRAGAWVIGLSTFLKAPLLGVGAGNFGELSRLSTGGHVWHLAHNVYIEYLAEAGILGVVMLLVGLGLAIRRLEPPTIRRAIQSDAGSPLRWGLLGAIVFAGLHGAVDHGIQIPATAFLLATVLGLLWPSVNEERDSLMGSRSPTEGAGIAGRLAATALVLVAMGAMTLGAYREVSAEFSIKPLRDAIVVHTLQRQRPPDSLSHLRAAIGGGEQAYRIGPLDADYARLLGRGYLHLCEGRSGAELILAEEWSAQAVRDCPVDTRSIATRRQIRERLASVSTAGRMPLPAR